MLFDTHAHLDDAKFDSDREDIIEHFADEGVSFVLNSSFNVKSARNALKLAEKYHFIYSSAGVHPHETKYANENTINDLKSILSHEKCIAIGEIGLDYFYDLSERILQRDWFEKQMQLAEELNLPVIIHDRDAHEESLEIIKKYNVKGVFHCFSGSKDMANELIKKGWYISFTGVVTFKNARKAIEVVESIDINKMFIETDSPYMAPEPFRGVRNEPKYVRYIAEKIAQIKKMSFAEVAEITKNNALSFFGIKNV